MTVRVDLGFSARWSAVGTLLLATLASTSFGWAQYPPVEVRAEVDRQTVAIGDPITYTLAISWGSGITVFPPSQQLALGDFEVLDFSASEPVEREDRFSQEFTYTIAIYAVGEYTIPGQEVPYEDVSGAVGSAAAPEVPITVESVLTGEELSLRPIKGPMAIPPRLSRILLVLLAGFLAGGATLFYLRWRRRPRGAASEARDVSPQLSPEEQAYRELEEIARRDLLSQGRLKEHYTLVSETVRRYVGRRFQIYTLERTTTEVLLELDPLLDNAELFRVISTFLRDCDAVKFAKYVPPKVDQHRLLRRAQGIVDLCTPPPETQPGEEAVPAAAHSHPNASTPLGRASP